MKSSTNTSMISTGFSGMVECREFGIITFSNFFQGSVVFPFTKSEMIYLAVSDHAQKNGGYLHHPICNAVGTTSSVLPREPVNHQWRGEYNRSSTLGDVRPLGTKTRQRCQDWQRERGSPDFSFLP